MVITVNRDDLPLIPAVTFCKQREKHKNYNVIRRIFLDTVLTYDDDLILTKESIRLEMYQVDM